MSLQLQMQAHRDALRAILGAPPDRAPLNPRILETADMETYRREKITYQLSPNEWGFAYLLIPHNITTPAPVVFCHHRHNRDWRIGKSEIVGLAGNSSGSIGLELVERGYIVFAPDAISFEDRAPKNINFDDPLEPYIHNFSELAVRLLRGETLLKKVIWDVSRGIDYLLTRQETDPNYIAIIGHGYGGKMAMWAMAFDERIIAGVAHGGIGSMHAALRQGLPIQVEFAVPRLLQIADYDRILSLAAPRPFLLSASRNDPESSDGELVYQKAKRTYQRMGAENRFSLYYYDPEPDEPLFPAHARHQAYSWLDNWLKPF
ncbi:MAG: hypothetical protein CUN55_11830 [Phototrophicales bacterium]|nr:MAG: hypothetical protein CUN55_11830 [Phototrophicales bacterium]